MPNLVINQNNQATVTIPKEIIKALKWKKGNNLLVSKAPSKYFIIIENISKEGKNE